MSKQLVATTKTDGNNTVREWIKSNAIEEPETTSTIVSIHNITMDSFEFWLNHDLMLISGTNGIRISYPFPEMGVPKWKDHVRSVVIRWSVNDPEHFNRTTIISWAQIHTDRLKVVIQSEGELYDELMRWLRERLEVKEKDITKGRDTLTITPELTPTEKKVAGYLAQEKTYEQIAKLLGNKSIHAARKHMQAIAHKWGTRQIPEMLWAEAKKRGYSATE